ncbi:MAG: hypothetical protein HOQ38_07905 [Nonomuraea sp.]|nr:hypothetical protein [Nonomuraea sp.]
MRITDYAAEGDARRFTVEYSAQADDPSGLMSQLAEDGELGEVLRELGHGRLREHVPGSVAEFRRVFAALGPALGALEERRRVLITAARHGFPGEFSWRGLAAELELAPTTVKRWVEAQGKDLRVAEDEVLVLLTVGEQALLVTSRHPAQAPLRMPATAIAEQAGLPMGELAGRRFSVRALSDTHADGFRLVDDPRL